MFHRVLACLFVLFAIAVLASFLAASGWPLDLLAHFQAQYVLGGLVFAAAFAACRRWPATVMALCLSLVALMRMDLFDDARFAATSDASGPSLRVAAANLFGSSEALDGLVEEHRKHAFDLMILTELPVPADDGLLARFPGLTHVTGMPGQALAGRPAAVVLSRNAPEEAELIRVGQNPSAITRARYCFADTRPCLDVFAVHPLPPFNPRYYQSQAAILHALADRAAQSEGPMLVAGDMNATSWAPLLQPLRDEAELRKVACGNRWSPTWLAPVPGLGLELDHFFVKGGLAVKNCALGSSNGSDHWPIFTELVSG
ncbi:endonuclease/exonuclease/phosphatase family protein [Rhodobacterales bacterium]|nr:endonuclease/exonuclease/phosphatase family protein [Rhodobacterales bacterium]